MTVSYPCDIISLALNEAPKRKALSQGKKTDARVVELADSLDSGSSVQYARAGSSPASRTMKGWQKRCQPFFLSIHAGLRAFGQKIRKTVLPWMSRAKSPVKPHKRGFCLIFQAGGPAFLRSAALFPVVKCVQVCACQIDRLTKAQNGPKSSPQNTRG